MDARSVGIDAAMWVLGLLAIVGLAWLVQWLDGTAVEVTEGVEVRAVDPDEPLAALTAGVARSAATARDSLARGARSRAAHATDAALRGAEVGHAAAPGETGRAFTVALQHLQEARESLHLGRPDRAVGRLGAAVDVLGGVVGPARRVDAGVPPPIVHPAYRGAVLVDANGSTIGRVRRIGDGSDPVALLRIGGADDVLGFLDLGGRNVRVPADRLLWGPRRSLGPVLVALPVESSAVGGVLEHLRTTG